MFRTALAILALGLGTFAGTARAGPTLADLQEAYNGESNAHARYLAFAKRADADGYAQIACLFRAVARTEEIHAANHAAVIRKIGAEPKADMRRPVVKTTKENLEAAIAEETRESGSLYPAFIAQAKEDNNAEAQRTFELVRNAELEHAKLFRDALANMESYRKATTALYVCGVCGYTMTKLPRKRCPSSSSPASQFEKVE